MLIIVPAILLILAYFTWKNIDTGLYLLFLLLPSYLIRYNLGPLPTTFLESLIWLIIAIWVFKILRKGEIKNLWQNLRSVISEEPSFFIAAGIFLIGATISVFTSVNLRGALGEWKAFYVEPVIIFFVLISIIGNKSVEAREKFKNNLIYFVILCGLITAILAIYQHFTGWLVPYSFWQNRNTYRVTAWYGFPNGVSLFLAPLFPLAIYLIKKSWPLKPAANLVARTTLIVSTIFLPAALLAIIYSKSAGGLVGVAAGIGLLLVWWKKTRWYAIAATVLTLGTLFFILPANNPVRIKLLAESRSGLLRRDIWGETTEFLAEHPIKGAGLASYSTLIYPFRIDKTIEVFHHPHNIFMTMWVNLGLIGLIGFVWIIVWFVRVAVTLAWRPENNSYLPLFLLSTMIVVLTTGLVDSPYIRNDLSLFFWLLPAVLIVKNNGYAK